MHGEQPFLAGKLLSRADQVLSSRAAFMAEARDRVGRWIEPQTGQLRWLRPEAGAFCCIQLDPGLFGPQEIHRFLARLAEQRTAIAPGPWFGDNAHIIRLGLAYEPMDKLEKGLDIIAGALDSITHRV